MSVFAKLRPSFKRAETDNVNAPVEMSNAESPKQDKEAALSATEASGINSPDDQSVDALPTEDAQRGVRDVESITLSWSKGTLIFVFCNIWMLYFINAFQSTVASSLEPFVVSAFEAHELLTVIGVVSDAMTAALFIPLAKIMDVFGRAEGFGIMAVFATLGLIMQAACHNIATYCAANVFYTLGFAGMTYCVDVITADSSTLRTRGLAYAFTSSPYIITAFAGPVVGNDFHYDVSWRWGYGAFAIMFPVIAAPLFIVLKLNLKKAKREGKRVEEAGSGRTWWQSFIHYSVQFDLIGVILFSLGLTIFYIPFDIAALAPNGWASGYIIAMIVVGLCLLITFGFYEWKFAPSPVFQMGFLNNRTVIGACILDFIYQISYYCWDSYFTSFLMVVNDLSYTAANDINNIFNIVSGVILLIVGWWIRRTGKFKWMLYVAVPMYTITTGLMIYFRRPNQSWGYLVMCQVFLSLSGSIFILLEQLAILAAVDHQHVAAVLALLNVVGTVGDATGYTISGSIWTNTFEAALERYLPAEALANIDDIYSDIDTQLAYPVGSATRIAIQKAYGYAQTRMLAAGTGVLAIAFISLILIKNIDLKAKPQVKGMVW